MKINILYKAINPKDKYFKNKANHKSLTLNYSRTYLSQIF